MLGFVGLYHFVQVNVEKNSDRNTEKKFMNEMFCLYPCQITNLDNVGDRKLGSGKNCINHQKGKNNTVQKCKTLVC